MLSVGTIHFEDRFCSGAILQQLLEFKGYEIASETIFGPKRCMHEYPLHHIELVSAFRSFANLASHTLHRVRLARLIIRLKLLEDLEGILSSLFAAISYYVSIFHHAVCIPWVHLPSTGPIWWRQASHGWGRKWSGWNRTNWTGSYGPGSYYTDQHCKALSLLSSYTQAPGMIFQV